MSTVKVSSEQPQLIKVKLTQIDRNPKKNHSRTLSDEYRTKAALEMAASIKALGRIENEPIVYEDKHGKFDYSLASGFTRCDGWEVLHGPEAEIWVKLRKFETDDEMRLFNLAENTARKDLKLYDVVRNCHYLLTKEMPQKKVAEALKLPSQSYVSKYKKAWDQLAPSVKAWWGEVPRREDEPAWEWIQKVADMPEPQQKQALEALLKGIDLDDPAAGDGSDEGEGGEANGAAKRPGKKALQMQLEKLEEKKKEGDDSELTKGKIAGVKYALGINKNL